MSGHIGDECGWSSFGRGAGNALARADGKLVRSDVALETDIQRAQDVSASAQLSKL